MNPADEQAYRRPARTWGQKFAAAGLGVLQGMRGQNSFIVHIIMTVAVIVAAFAFGLCVAEWGLVLLCITSVITAELFNSSLEKIGQAIDRQHNPLLGSALDIASGAVLMAASGAAVVGIIVFLPHALQWGS